MDVTIQPIFFFSEACVQPGHVIIARAVLHERRVDPFFLYRYPTSCAYGYWLENPLHQMETATFAADIACLWSYLPLGVQYPGELSTQCRCLCCLYSCKCSGFPCLADFRKPALGEVRRWENGEGAFLTGEVLLVYLSGIYCIKEDGPARQTLFLNSRIFTALLMREQEVLRIA